MRQAKKTFSLYDAKGDLSKKWFVYYRENGQRIRKYGDINQHATVEGRHAAAKKLIADLQKTARPDTAAGMQQKAMQKALDAKKNHLRKKSFQSYQSKLNALFEYAGPCEITNKLLKDFFEHLSQHQAAGTVADAMFTIKRILAGEGRENLMAGIVPPAYTQVPKRFFQRYQVQQIVSFLETEDPSLLLWCKFVYYCFLRPRSELRLLKIQDIYFENREIIVPGKVSKNKKTEPVIIPDAFWPDVEPLQRFPPGRYIFPGKGEAPTGYNTMGVRFAKVLQELGFDSTHFSVYSWKHTGAVEFYRATHDLVGLQAQLRHHSLDQVKAYLRQLQVSDFPAVRSSFPGI